MRSFSLTPARVRAFWRVKPFFDFTLQAILGLDAETYRLLETAGQLRGALCDPDQARERVEEIVTGHTEIRQWPQEVFDDLPF